MKPRRRRSSRIASEITRSGAGKLAALAYGFSVRLLRIGHGAS